MIQMSCRLGGKLITPKGPVYYIGIWLILLVVPGCGVEVCESEDAILLFPNTSPNSAGDIRAKTWNKENGIHLASWMAKTNFMPSPLYSDRLVAIGENSIKIRNARRHDTGTYTLVQTSGSTQSFIEHTVYLEVIVPPTAECIPNITHEGDNLWAILPPESCGLPMLTPNWTSGTQKLISDRISVLDLKTETKKEVYIVCAVGNSLRCSHLDSSNLCRNYKNLKNQNQQTEKKKIKRPRYRPQSAARQYIPWRKQDIDIIRKYFHDYVSDTRTFDYKGSLPGKLEIGTFFKIHPDVLSGLSLRKKERALKSKLFSERKKSRKIVQQQVKKITSDQ